jgi:hypothetical protein
MLALLRIFSSSIMRIVTTVYKGYSSEPENVPFNNRTLPFIYRSKLYALFMNGKNETGLYRQCVVIQRCPIRQV